MFTINGEVWMVKFCHPNHPMLRRSNGSAAIGSCDNNTKSIYLNRNLNGKMLKKVLCHELTHAAMFSYNVNLSYEQEELLADLLATYGEEIIDITDSLFDRLKERH